MDAQPIGTTQGDHAQDLRQKLFELFELARDIETLHEATGGEVDWKSEQLQAWLEQSSGQTVEQLCDFIAQAEAMETLAKKRAKHYSEVARRQVAKQEWANKLLVDVLKQLGVRKIEHGLCNVHVRKGSTSVKQKGEVPLALLDSKLVREVPSEIEPDLKAIGELLKKIAKERAEIEARRERGEEVEDLPLEQVEQYFELVTGPETAVIK